MKVGGSTVLFGHCRLWIERGGLASMVPLGQGSFMTTVRDTLQLPTLAGSYLAGGEAGLGRLVTAVNVMEVPDIEDYLAPGEFLLTTAYPLQGRSDSLTEFVAALARRGVVAIGLKPHRFLRGVPATMVEACKAWSLPLVILPDDASFNTIMAEVLSVTRDGSAPFDAGSFERRLTQATIGGGGLPAMANTLAAALGCDVRILDANDAVLAQTDRPGDVEWSESTGQSWPVRVSGREQGRVQVAGLGEVSARQSELIRLTCFAIAMHIAQERSHLELQRRQLVLYLEELVSGMVDRQVAHERAALFGWPAGPYMVVVAVGQRELLDADVVTASSRVLPGAMAWAHGHEAIAIVPCPPDGVDLVVLEEWRSALPSVFVVGAGSVATDVEALAGSHEHAREAVKLAGASGLTCARFADLTLERLISSMPPAMLEAFVTAELGPLLQADKRGTNLCETLHLYLTTNNAAQAARELFIHYNTMKARLERIRSLLGDKLDSPRGRVSLLLALEARHVRGLPPRP